MDASSFVKSGSVIIEFKCKFSVKPIILFPPSIFKIGDEGTIKISNIFYVFVVSSDLVMLAFKIREYGF